MTTTSAMPDADATTDPHAVPVLLPQLGETVTAATLTRWLKQPGEDVAVGEPLFEVATDKVDTEVPAEHAGRLTALLVAEGDTVPVGTPVATLTVAAPAAAPMTPSATPSAAPSPALAAPRDEPAVDPAAAPAPGGVVTSPLTRRLLRELAVDPATVTPSGVGGRITRADVLAAADHASLRDAVTAVRTTHRAALDRLADEPPVELTPDELAAGRARATALLEPAPTTPADRLLAAQVELGTAGTLDRSGDRPADPDAPAPGTSRLPLSRIRRITGARLHASVTTIPHVLSVVEVDLANVERARQAHKDAFKAREGFSLTYLPFIAHALADALRAYPQLNAHLVEYDTDPTLVLHRAVHLGVAVDLDGAGLVVPTVFDADGLRVPLLARRIREAAEKARAGTLAPAEMAGGTFTVSNNGSAGSHLTAAIINPPQVAILSTDAVRRVPVAVTTPDGDEVVVVHPVCNLSLSWDHRAFDGAYAAGFLTTLKRLLESRDWVAELT